LEKLEAILKNESSGNSYLINEPSKINIFPNYFIGILKCSYLINNEKYIGEGIGMLIGEDIILTSAHNLIYSQLEDENILNYKPSKITFHLLNNGNFEIIEPLNCEVDTIIFSEYFKEFKFVNNEELEKSCLSVFDKMKKNCYNIYENQDNLNINKFINKQSYDFNSPFSNEEFLNNFYKNKNNHNFNSYEHKSISTDFTNIKKQKRRLTKNINMNNISEIPLEEDYAIIFTESKIGVDILNCFCEEDSKYNLTLKELDEETKIFKFFERHVELISLLENSNENKFQDSKISMISTIKYNSNLLSVPQYVYGSHFNALNNRFHKFNQEKNLKKEINKVITEESKIQNSNNLNCNIFYNNKINNSSVSSNLDFTLNNNYKYDLDSSMTTVKKRKWEKEVKNCLLINYDKDNYKKNIRNSKLDNLKKLFNFNNEEFFTEGKSVQCEARGKLCKILFESEYKNPKTIQNPRYEKFEEISTPYFKKKKNEKEEINEIENQYLSNNEEKTNFSFHELNNNDCNDDNNCSLVLFKDMNYPEINQTEGSDNVKNTKLYSKLFNSGKEEFPIQSNPHNINAYQDINNNNYSTEDHKIKNNLQKKDLQGVTQIEKVNKFSEVKKNISDKSIIHENQQKRKLSFYCKNKNKFSTSSNHMNYIRRYTNVKCNNFY